ncbi:MAG: type I DNA topoisomerase [Firmicutes bacterium]|nr:type I DNA topoisomerase [Bacillota bacterium]
MAAAKKTLVIVESPSKAKTIGKFLGSRYKVVASVGHVRDLPKSKLGVDVENDFEPQYISIRGKGSLIKELKKEAKNASKVYLATDPDREGEAISWHLAYLLGIDAHSKCRIVFNEITAKTIKEAIKNPREIDLSLVDAQQARRVLDRLVGYQISPLLWRKVRRGLSAGRVQSAALKIICDRENLINDFNPEEYWTITAKFAKKPEFVARLADKDGKKLNIPDGESADAILKELKQGSFVVKSLEEKERQRRPAAPYTTSSLQQDAANKINFTSRKTMMVAQQLYEGVDIKGQGTIGLVSYIRTDSVRISEEARAAAKEYIIDNLGEEYYANNFYSNKKKDVQDAHEAIRPSRVELTPDSIKASLTKDQYKLYRLIWIRFVASQMAPAEFMSVNSYIVNGSYGFKASGNKLLFDGFLKVNPPGKDADINKLLPQMKVGEELETKAIDSEQNFTQPPPRFTEAALVKELEDKEIGRPSTYAPIVATLTERRYVKKDKKSLVPTELGFIVIDMIGHYFAEIVDVDFTAQMEQKLDDVEIDKTPWKDVIRGFYSNFSKELEQAEEEIIKVEFEDEPTGEICEKCGRPMVKKHGRYGVFAACQGYPECKNAKPIVETIGVSCPSCGKDIIKKRSRKGKLFYGCSGYPECQQVFWNKPTDRKCPKCGALIVEKPGKGDKFECSNRECGYKEG